MPSAFHRTTAAQAPTGPFTVIDIASIQTARENLRGQVLKTPFTLSRTLSDIFGAEIWLKFENLQFTASFKERGALNRMLTLSEAEARQGRDRRVRRQPRAGRGLPCAAHGRAGGDRHAALRPP